MAGIISFPCDMCFGSGPLELDPALVSALSTESGEVKTVRNITVRETMDLMLLSEPTCHLIAALKFVLLIENTI